MLERRHPERPESPKSHDTPAIVPAWPLRFAFFSAFPTHPPPSQALTPTPTLRCTAGHIPSAPQDIYPPPAQTSLSRWHYPQQVTLGIKGESGHTVSLACGSTATGCSSKGGRAAAPLAPPVDPCRAPQVLPGEQRVGRQGALCRSRVPQGRRSDWDEGGGHPTQRALAPWQDGTFLGLRLPGSL